MELLDVLELAEDLLEIHGFAADGWTVEFFRSFDKAGRCNHTLKVIMLEVRHMLAYNQEQVEQIILHELGHAKAGFAADHGIEWVKAVRELGGKPKQEAPPFKADGDPLRFIAILASLIFTGFWFSPLWGALAILIAVLALLPKLWRRFGPIEDVYKLPR